MGTLISREYIDGDVRLGIEVPSGLVDRCDTGDSLAVGGVCLTIVERNANRLLFDVSAETLSATRLGKLESGARVNLERALGASDPMGGHFVTGHVDGIGEVLGVTPEGRSHRVEIEAPKSLSIYITKKGCITVDGVSLTVNDVNGSKFGFNVVPHTWSVTNMQEYAVGTLVHLEVDIISRYVERLMSEREAVPVEEDITPDYLSNRGFAPPLVDNEEEYDGSQGNKARDPDSA